MKDFFNQRQRYSLRKYSIGVCSVLLGIVLFSGQAVQADEVITGNDNVVKSVEAAESAISDTTISEVPTAIEKLPVEEVVTVQNEKVSIQQDTSSETNTSRNSTSFASSEESYVAQVNQSQATSDLSEGLKSDTVTSETSRFSLRRVRVLATVETVESPTEILSSEAIPAEVPIRRSGRRGRNLSSLNTSESNNGTPINSSLPTVTIPTSNQNNTLATPDENITKSTKQTVAFEGAGEKTPATNIKDDYVFTGKKDLITNAITWKTSSHTYGSVPVPVVPGYYADKAEAGFKTVTLDEPEVTDKVIYKPLGKIIQVDENFNVIPNSNSVTYENNPYNPREAIETAIPAAPAGYKIRELQPHAWGYNIVDKTIEPNDESDPDRISKDTPIVYVPLTSDVTKSTKQTVVFEGAGEKTPATNIKDDYVFTGKKDLITNAITWKTSSHTYGSVPVPVVPGYYADKAEAGFKTVTLDEPEVTDKVIYKPLGKIIQVDENFNVIPNSNSVTYENNPYNPREALETAIPAAPAGYKIRELQPHAWGYNIVDKTIEPNDESDPDRISKDTPIVYVPLTSDVTKSTKQTVAFEGAGEKTPAINVKDDYVFTGKKDLTTNAITWKTSSHTYVSVPVPVVPGYIADKSQAGQLEVTIATPNAEETVSYTPVGRIILVDEAGNQIVGTDAVPYNNALDPTKVESTTLPTLPTGYEIKSGQNITGLNLSNLQVLPSDATADTKIILVSKKESLRQGTSQTVTFVGAGEKTPATKVQNDFVFTGTKDMVSGVSTWDMSSHTYGSVSVPVVSGYIANVGHAGSLQVTPEAPNAEELVTYKPLGKIIAVDTDGKEIQGVPTIQYQNDPENPTKAGKTLSPLISGYETDVLNITPSKPEEDTPVVYRKAIQEATITYIDQTTGTSLESDHVTGKSGEIIEYTTADKIAFYESRGYELLTDEFPKQAYYDTDTSVTQAWRVTLKHKTVIVGSSNPHDGDAINPDDSLSPKYPSKNQWQKDVTATVHYVVSDGNVKAPSDKVQVAQWTRTVTYDMVTGQELSSTAWKANKATYDAVVTEVLEGYYADKASVSSKKVIQENLEETIIYKPLGSLLLKSEDSNFLEVASVKYPNNLTDPTKSGLPVVPDIPGYKPYLQDPKYPSKFGKAIQSGSTIIPENSGEDTLIYYIAINQDKPKSPVNQTSKPSKTLQPEHPSTEKKSVVSSQPEEVKQVNEASRIVVKTASQTSTTKVASYKKQVVLPRTGEETEQTVEVAGFSALIVALGLGIQGYRRKKED